MKNIKYVVFTIIFVLLNIFYVNASCTDEELNNLRDKTSDIKVTYKHLGKVETDEDVYYNNFEVKVKNVDEDFYISLFNNTILLTPSNGEIIETFNNGTWILDIYSNKCDQKISEIKVLIPRFNMYSLDPLCEGIDGDDFPLCGKYYEYDVSYDNFVSRVKHYRTTHNINNINNSQDTGNENNIFNVVLKYFMKYRLYVVISLVVILVILIIIIIVRKRKKRGVLK